LNKSYLTDKQNNKSPGKRQIKANRQLTKPNKPLLVALRNVYAGE